ncbi:MAG: beta strand repeat-containing protein, partial [Isosphaeraceae bacterium]
KAGDYPGGINTTSKTITLGTGDGTTVGPVNVTTGNMTLSSTTSLSVRLMGNTTGNYTQINMQSASASANFANATIIYSNVNGFTPTVGDNFKVINQVPSSTNATTSRFQANVVGTGVTTLQEQGRYQLASGQYFATLYQGITGTDRNDFVLVSVPQYVTNVVVYKDWSNLYFGDPVNYVDPSGATQQLTYGVSAAGSIANGLNQLQVQANGSGSISIANATYSEVFGGYTGNGSLTYNVIGACSSTNTALGNVNGNITVDSINLSSSSTLNMRVNAGSGFTTFDQINTNGSIALNDAYGNFTFNGNFSNPGLSTGSFLPLINNTNTTSTISGRFRFANGTTIINGTFFPVSGQTDKGFYSTYTLGTAVPYNDFALIYNYKLGSVPNVAVNQTWSTSNLDFGAFVTMGNTTYTIGIDAFGEMRDYTPSGGVNLVGGVAAVSPTGNIQIAAGTYNSTFTVDKGFSLTGPTTGNALFPASTGQTALYGNSTRAANITAGSWTNNLLFGNLLVGNGTIFDNAARLIDNNGSLFFQSGVTFSSVSLSTGKSILISSNVTGSPATLQSSTGGTVVTVSGTNVNATLSDIVLGGTGRGVNMTNTGSVTFNNVTGVGSLSSIGTINGPTTLTLNYPLSTANNTLTVRGGSLNFTPLGTSNLSLSGQTGMTFNANIGTSAGSAGNNTIVLAANSTFAGGVIATGSGVDAFTISAPQPMTIKGGGGNDTLSIAAANAYLSSYDGEAGVNTFRSGPNSLNYIDLGASGTGGAYLSRGNTTTRSAFANVAKVYGNGFTDIFSVTDNNAAFALVNGGNGNDQLNFNGTSGANTTFDVTRQLQATITGASAGSVSYYNFANTTATVSMIESFVSVENVKGGSGDDTIVMAYGGSLSGSLNGGAGNNTIDYSAFLAPTSSSITPGVRVDLTSGSATAIGGSAAYRVTNFRDIYGTVGFDILNGDAGNNIIDGGDGADSITGQAGNDILIGGLGADTVRGGTGDNIDIGGYVNFEGGGNLTAYGIPAAYKPFVLRSMMNSWSTGNNTATVFDNNANALSLTGVNVQVPGNTTSYTGIKLIAATSLTDPVRGTVFDDGQVDTLDMQSSSFNWIFVPQFPADNIINGTPRKVTYVYKLIP